MAGKRFWPAWDSDKRDAPADSDGPDNDVTQYVPPADDRAQPSRIGVFDDDPLLDDPMVPPESPSELTSDEFAAELLDEEAYRSNQPKSWSRRFRKGIGKVMIAAGAAIAAVVVLYAVDLFLSWGKVPRGVTVAGVDVGGMNRTSAEQKLREQLEPRFNEPVKIRAGDVDTELNPGESGLGVDWQATLEQAGSQPWNPLTRFWSFFSDREVGVVDKNDKNVLKRSVVTLANTKINHGKTEGDISFTDVPNKPGAVKAEAVDPRQGQELKDVNAAVNRIGTSWLTTNGVDLPVDSDPATATRDGVHATLDKLVTPAVSGPVEVKGQKARTELQPNVISEAFDFVPQPDGSLKAEVDKQLLQDTLAPTFTPTEQEAADAEIVFSGGKPEVKKGKEGRSVDWTKTLDPYLDVITKKDKRTLNVAYTKKEPKVSTADAEALGIEEVIGEFDMTGRGAREARSAADAVNGTIVEPGESFSLNEHTNGASGAGASVFATTLYNAAYFAGLKDDEHTPHEVYVEGMPEGRDATVDDGNDLVFTNDADTGIAIQTAVSGSDVSVKIWGTKRFDVESDTSGRRNVVEPPERVRGGSSCRPSKGTEGFTVTDTRTLTPVDSGDERTETNAVTYKPEPAVKCEDESDDDGPDEPSSGPSDDPSSEPSRPSTEPSDDRPGIRPPARNGG